MLHVIGLLLTSLLRCFRSRQSLLLENLVLRQQFAVLKRKHPRPRLAPADKLFWVLARRFWSGWKQALILVSPDTVVRWHRAGFKLHVAEELGMDSVGVDIDPKVCKVAKKFLRWTVEADTRSGGW